MALVLALAYGLVMTLSGLYFYRLLALTLHARMRGWKQPPPAQGSDLPTVTVQLPLYNEGAVVGRLLEAVFRLEYPAERLEIQALDDSTDGSSDLIARLVRDGQERGLRIEQLRRADRAGYKSGNLAHGLTHAKGEFIAIFDADFIPEAGWLRQAMGHFMQPGSDGLGLVQTRWGHLNGHKSALTYAQMLSVDDFTIAQTTRQRLGLWSSFYGSAGLWRRACIEDAGGWSAATLTEDLDLAYRAQLGGWRIAYEDSLLVSAELPETMLAYKQQQFRWARGNMQVMRLLWRDLLHGPVTFMQKIDALLFATWPVSHAINVALLLLCLLVFGWPSDMTPGQDLFLAIGYLGYLLMLLADGLRGGIRPPLHLLLGTGNSLNISRGMIAGLFGPLGGEFHSTPRGGSGSVSQRPGLLWSTAGEVLLAALSLGGLLLAIQTGRWLTLPTLIVSALGYAWVGGVSLLELIEQHRKARPKAQPLDRKTER